MANSEIEKGGTTPTAKNNGKSGKGKEGGGEGVEQEDMNRMVDEALQRNRIQNVFYEELEPLELLDLSTRSTTNSGFYNGFVVECPTTDKRQEKNQRLIDIKSIMDEIKDLKKTPNYDENELSDLLRKINTIKAEYMTENKFFGYQKKEDSGFNYGREVVKGCLDDKLEIPYSRIDLYQFPNSVTSMFKGSRSTKENNFVFSGVKRGAILKGGVRLICLDDQQNAIGDTSNFEFNIFEPFLLGIFKETCQVKVRLNVLRALNLAAQSNAIQVKYNLGGYNALSSADPYPKVQVGDGKNDVNSGVLKFYNDSKNFVEKTLNPDFFRNYELDAFLPADWNFMLMIYNKGQILLDSLIGETSIDIEDRYYSNKCRLRAYSLMKRSAELKRIIKRLQNQAPIPQGEIRLKNDELKNLELYLNPLIDSWPTQPIEYCFLNQPGINTMQGSAEILLEVFQMSEIRKMPAAKFEAPKPVKYQIRLIIWEAFDIPLGDKSAVNVMFRVILDNEGWAVDGVSKETDVHNGSDGYAIFNWRMLFDLQLPCAFPRLKISAYDFDAFGSDDSIGEVTLKFDNIINKLKNEGKYEAPQKRVKLKNVKKDGEESGEVLISFKIMQSSEAASVPVGEGQEEPNTDPFLEKPKLGRGIGDFFKKLGFNFNFNFGMFFYMKMICMLTTGILVFVVLFIKPGILLK